MKKKYFSIFAMFTMDALMLHLVALSIGMLANNLNHVLLTITCILANLFFFTHVIMAFIKMHKVEGKSMGYLKYNYKTVIQRVTAILMIVLLVVHIILSKSLENINNLGIGKRILVFIVEEIFFIDVLAHICVSSPKAQLALGSIKDEEHLKKQEKIELIKDSALLLFATIALIIYVFGGLL